LVRRMKETGGASGDETSRSPSPTSFGHRRRMRGESSSKMGKIQLWPDSLGWPGQGRLEQKEPRVWRAATRWWQTRVGVFWTLVALVEVPEKRRDSRVAGPSGDMLASA